MSLERRIAHLEDELSTADDGPSLAERLTAALAAAKAAAMERHQLGLPRPEPPELPPEPPEGDSPLMRRLRKARARAAACRAELARTDEALR